MKRIVCFLLIVTMMASLVGCQTQTSKPVITTCQNCNAEVVNNAKFCPECGKSMIGIEGTTNAPMVESTEEPTTEEVTEGKQLFDYSRFSFNNMYGLTEWIEISNGYMNDADYYLSGLDARFSIYGVNRSDSVYQVLNFENGYIEVRDFGKKQPLFTGNRSLGELRGTYQYHTVNSSLVAIKAGREPNIELSVSIWEGIPLITISARGDSYGLEFLDGVFIPTKFLDIERSKIYEDYMAVYCINADYVNPRVEKYYNFAVSVMEAAYKDFDASALLDYMHPEIRKAYEVAYREEGKDSEKELSSMFSDYKEKLVGEIYWQDWLMFLQQDNEAENDESVNELLSYIAEIEAESVNIDADSCGVVQFKLFNNSMMRDLWLYIVEVDGKMYFLNIESLVSIFNELLN